MPPVALALSALLRSLSVFWCVIWVSLDRISELLILDPLLPYDLGHRSAPLT